MARYIQPPSGQLMQAMLQAQQQKSQRRQAIGQSIEGVVKKFQDDKIKKQNALNDAMFQKAKITLDFRSKFNINKPGGTPATEEVARVVGVAPGTLISRKEDKVKPVRQHTLTASDQKLINTQEKTMAVDIFKTKFNAANKIEANRVRNSKMSVKEKVQTYLKMANDYQQAAWNNAQNSPPHNWNMAQSDKYLKMANDLNPSNYRLEKTEYKTPGKKRLIRSDLPPIKRTGFRVVRKDGSGKPTDSVDSKSDVTSGDNEFYSKEPLGKAKIMLKEANAGFNEDEDEKQKKGESSESFNKRKAAYIKEEMELYGFGKEYKQLMDKPKTPKTPSKKEYKSLGELQADYDAKKITGPEVQKILKAKGW